jgi:hypothetical protein
MSTTAFVLILALVVGLVYGLNRLQARTERQILIPFDGDTFPRDTVRQALERVGCTIVQNSADEVCGSLPLDGLNWGQKITVRMKDRQLLVRSSFTGSQVFGGSKNQKNIDLFLKEWNQRANYACASPVELASLEVFARKNARKSLLIGSLMALVGGGLLALVVFVPAREGSSPGSKYRLIGLAAPVLLIGLVSVWAGARRLYGRSNK